MKLLSGVAASVQTGKAKSQAPNMDDSARYSGHTLPAYGSPSDLSANRTPHHNDPVTTQDKETGVHGQREGTSIPVPHEWTRVCKLAVKHLDRCVSLEPKVLLGDDPDAIHDLRVATRRLQQVLDLIFPTPRPGELRKLRRRLRRCRRSLSEVRNFDVLLERVDATLARKRTARREAWEAIRGYLKESRTVKLETALRKLTKANLSAIYVRMKDCLPAKGHSHLATETADQLCAGENPNAGQFYVRVSEGLRTVWDAFELEVAQSRHGADPAVLHRTRIAAKRVRYLIEVIHAFDVAGSKEALIWLRNLQKHLGRWHDLVIFEDTVIGMIADPAFLRNHLKIAMEIERLILRNRALKTKLEKKYLEMTTDKTGFFRTKEWVRRVAETPADVFAESS